MNWYYTFAGCLAIVLGLIHSCMGEILIFRRLAVGKPTAAKYGDISLSTRHVRILRVTWHIATILALGIGLILFMISRKTGSVFQDSGIELVATLSFLSCSLLTFIGTRAKHPGWIVLLAISILLWLG